jgi:hypothetical protein
MALNTVTLKWNVTDLIQSGLAATLFITPTAQMADAADHIEIPAVPQQVTFYGTGQLPGIVANDDTQILPAGTGYLISVVAASGRVIIPQFQAQILFANGAIQWLDALAPVPVVTTGFQYLPLPSGVPGAGQVPAATGAGEASAWETLTAALVGADAAGAAAAVQALAALRSNNLTDLASVAAARANLGAGVPSGIVPSGAIAQSIPLWFATSSAALATISGTLYLQGITLGAGELISNITYAIGSASGSGLTHGWFVLLNSALLQVAHTADQTSGNMAVNSAVTKALVTPYTTPAAGSYFMGFMAVATGQPSLAGSGSTEAGSAFLVYPNAGASSTGLSTPGTDGVTTYAAMSAAGAVPYGYVS